MRFCWFCIAGVLWSCDAVVGELGEAEKPPAPLPQSAPLINKLLCTPMVGDAPLKVDCELGVTHSAGKPVSCKLESGDGAASTPVADCLSPQKFAFTYPRPGSYTLKVSAADPEQTTTVSTVAITVNVRPNQPPVIDDFSASPTRGGAPFSSNLTWRVSDPENDALTCKLNDMAIDCAAAGAPWVVQAPGMVTVTLTVTDALGASTTRTVTLEAVMAVGDVRVSKVEWGQTVLLPDLRLVAGKDALLRVHILADRSGLSGVTAEVTGKQGTTDLGKLTLTGPSAVPTAEVPADLTRQWVVTVPGAWVAAGVELTLKIDAADALPETDEANNVQVLRPVVGKGSVMQLTAVPVMHQGMMPTITNLDGPMARIWPVKGVDAQTRAVYSFGGSLSGGATGAWGDLLDDIAQLRQMDGSSRNYYGFVKVSYQAGVAGIGYIAQEAAVGRDDSIDTALHELGHNMGRNHAPCGGAAGADPNFPYSGARIGSWGYDAVTQRLLNPANFVDLMSYCSPEWVSDYNYRAVQRFMETQPYVPPSVAPYVTAVAVSGRVAPGGVSLRPVHRVRARLPEELGFSSSWVVVKFTDGRERAAPIELSEIADLDAPEFSFSALVEDLGPIASVEVFRDGQRVLGQSPRHSLDPRPKVSLWRISPVELGVVWDAQTYRSVAVTHVGATPTVLSLSLTGGMGRVRIDGLGDGQIELSLSSGVDATVVSVDLPSR